jgi:mono/diheme cytochrome c family protein
MFSKCKLCWRVRQPSEILSQPMKIKARALLAILPFCWLFLFGQESGNAAATAFSKDIAPILTKKCVACHGPEKSKGHFRLDTFDFLMKGGESKSASVVPGQPEESELFRRLTAKDEDDRMPQKEDPLPQAQISLIESWIKEGAKFDGVDAKAPLVTLIPKEPHPDPPEVYRRPVPIMALAFSRTGNELAVGGYHEITIWNPGDGRLLRRIKNVAQRTHSLDYSPDGSLLAAAGGSPGQLGEVVLFNPATGELVKALATMADMALTTGFNPDGSRLAVGGADNAIRIYDVASGKEQLVIQQHADWVMAVAWSPDGAHLASASRDRTARVYDAKTGGLETSYTGHQGPVYAVAFSDDGKRVYSAGRDKKVHVWEAQDGKPAGEIGGFTDDIFKVVVLDKSVFSCSADKIIRRHSTGKRELIRAFSGHTDWVYTFAVDATSKRLASGSYDGEVRVWDLENGQTLTAFVASPGYHAAKETVRASVRE